MVPEFKRFRSLIHLSIQNSGMNLIWEYKIPLQENVLPVVQTWSRELGNPVVLGCSLTLIATLYDQSTNFWGVWGERTMPLILAVLLYVYFWHYKKIINKYIPDLPRWFKCFKLQSVTQKPQSVSDLNDSRASEICHVLWSKIKKEMLKAPGNLKGTAVKPNRNAHIPASVWVLSGTEVQVARNKDPVSFEYSWTTLTIKISAVKGRWTQGTFRHSFAGCCCCYSPFPAHLWGWAHIQKMQTHVHMRNTSGQHTHHHKAFSESHVRLRALT